MGNASGYASAIVFSGIAPHPPIMVPEVGGDSIAEVRGSIDAMAEFTRRIIESGAETVVLISPHAPLDPRAFVAYGGPQLHGDFAKFRAPTTLIDFELDQHLLVALSAAAGEQQFEVVKLDSFELDHGTAVPLYFLDRNGWNGRVVALGYSFRSNQDHLDFGACIRSAVDTVGRPVALIASGDLSHRLKPEAPAGYHPQAHLFDEQVVEALRRNSASQIVDIDQDLRRMAGECGYRSMLVALGATRGLRAAGDVLHYEAPFGVGYLVAQLTNAKAPDESANVDTKSADADDARTINEPPLSEADVSRQDACAPSSGAPSLSLPALARLAVETFVLTGKQIPPPASVSGILSARAACFVTIRSNPAPHLSADLRGCIGTIEPAKRTLAEELIANAIKAATRDPRFGPVSIEELTSLSYSVDVLSAPEPATFAELNPEIYGVIVEDEAGTARGLLLPDIEGVDTPAKQVEIAARKAGIPPGTPLKFLRFRVDRYQE
ncbi:MAG: AmmeMemoRadiSam system protein A [Pyrinomonadaceae bacterium]|nr:AmmeMemoRadiSam system protein A [Pyrinomonadaceae bacterium]